MSRGRVREMTHVGQQPQKTIPGTTRLTTQNWGYNSHGLTKITQKIIEKIMPALMSLNSCCDTEMTASGCSRWLPLMLFLPQVSWGKKGVFPSRCRQVIAQRSCLIIWVFSLSLTYKIKHFEATVSVIRHYMSKIELIWKMCKVLRLVTV